ncbi:hypothetical protein, partial [Pseudomonas aeruginosa]|uniref:hypothetical protein n=1 Tax=Pseudomonas aeruginosa TaxID=287 RepID=UPI0019690B37
YRIKILFDYFFCGSVSNHVVGGKNVQPKIAQVPSRLLNKPELCQGKEGASKIECSAATLNERLRKRDGAWTESSQPFC